MNKKPKKQTRLKKNEQVRDKKKQTKASGFAIVDYYEPMGNLSESQIRDLIITSFWIDNCINIITDEVTKYPLVAKSTDRENESSIKRTAEVNAFLKYPSNRDPISIIRKMILKDMLRYGNGCGVINYKDGKPSTLVATPGYALRVTAKEPHTYKFIDINAKSKFKTKKIRIKDKKTGKVKTVEKDIELPQKAVLHFALERDSDSTLGRSPLVRIYDMLKTDKNINKNIHKFTKRGFYMPAFIALEQITGTEGQSFIEYMNNIMGEGAKAFGINKKASVSALPFWSTKEIIEMHKWIGLCIAHTYKVPPFMMNLIEDVGSLNAREQKARFLENVVLPLLNYENFLYTLMLVKKGFKYDDVVIETPTIGTRLNYDKARISRLLVGSTDSILTVDEAREMFFDLKPKEKEPVEEEKEPKEEE